MLLQLEISSKLTGFYAKSATKPSNIMLSGTRIIDRRFIFQQWSQTSKLCKNLSWEFRKERSIKNYDLAAAITRFEPYWKAKELTGSAGEKIMSNISNLFMDIVTKRMDENLKWNAIEIIDQNASYCQEKLCVSVIKKEVVISTNRKYDKIIIQND